MTSKIQQQIKEHEEAIAKLKAQLQQEQSKETLIVTLQDGRRIEIEKEIHHKDQTYTECEKDCPQGWEIATYPILQELRNTEHREELHLLNTWEFIQQPDEISKEYNYVARFGANSGRAGLYCDWDPSGADPALGVRYFRVVKK